MVDVVVNHDETTQLDVLVIKNNATALKHNAVYKTPVEAFKMLDKLQNMFNN